MTPSRDLYLATSNLICPSPTLSRSHTDLGDFVKAVHLSFTRPNTRTRSRSAGITAGLASGCDRNVSVSSRRPSCSAAPFACISSTSSHLAPPQQLFELARREVGRATETNLRVVRVTGDGRCMFRSLALGLAAARNQNMGSSREELEADQLRMAVADAMCKSVKRRQDFPEAMVAVKAESDFDRYCTRLTKPSFWGGEAELLVLAKMLKQPIGVYISDKKQGGFRLIQEYGGKFNIENGGKRKPIKLLFNGSNHYDLLLG